MNWLATIWCMAASVCVTLAIIHLLVWLLHREGRVHLLFAVAAFAVAGVAVCEVQLMRSQTGAQFGAWLRLMHVPFFFAVVSMVWFVRVCFGTGRTWLAWTVCGLRFFYLVLNFIYSPNFNYSEISAVRQVPAFGGGTVSVAVGVLSQRTRLGQISCLLIVAYVIDASIALWRRGGVEERRRALTIGTSVVTFFLVSSGQTALVLAGVIRTPYVISLAFLIPVAVMAYELAVNVARAAKLRSELDRSKAELRDTTESMELAANAAGLAMWKWDSDKDEIWMSQRGRALFGLGGQDRISLQRFLRVLHPEDRQTVLSSVVNATRGDDDYQGEFRVLMPDGHPRWVVSRGRVEFNGRSMPIRMHGVSVDVTARKEAEEVLRQSEARFREMADAAPAMIWMSDANLRCTFVNKGWLEFTGRRLPQEMGDGWAEGIHPDDGKDSVSAMNGAVAARERFTLEYRLRGADGEYHWVLDSGVPHLARDGTLLGYIGTAIDITERKAIEQDQMVQRSELFHLSRVAMLGELLGSLSHELHQPLTVILTNAQAAQQLLAMTPVDHVEIGEIVNDIVSADKRAAEVISRLRLLFRKGELRHEALDLNDVVLDVLKLMNSDLIHRGVSLHGELAPGLPRIKGDRVQLQQVIINLIMNATDAMGHVAPAERSLTVRTGLDDRGGVELCVIDTGCGIPAGQTERVFEPFHTTKPKGLGLGLAVCRTIITAHSGRLWAVNNPDRGASFHVALSREAAMAG